MNRKSGQKGYTLIEALVVVAIVGIVSMVTIPNFMQYMRSAKLKNDARQFAIDLREARQRAVTRYHPTKISFKAGAGLNQYLVADGAYDNTEAGGVKWTKINPNTEQETTQNQEFDVSVYFDATTLVDGPDADDWVDIVFMPNGKISEGTTSAGGYVPPDPEPATVTIKSLDDIPKDTYVLELYSTGKIRVN